MPGLSEYLASKRVMACGPTNLGALLTTLQIGFKTAAIERRSGELWELLSAFRHEFRNFVQILEKAQKKLQEAQDTIENAAKKTRTIDKKLKTCPRSRMSAQSSPRQRSRRRGIIQNRKKLLVFFIKIHTTGIDFPRILYYNITMKIQKIIQERALPAETEFVFSEKTVQGAKTGKKDDLLFVRSPRRFKLYTDGCDEVTFLKARATSNGRAAKLPLPQGIAFSLKNAANTK